MSLKFFNRKINTQRGSVFFYIFIAIVLIAALTYSVSNNSRTNTSILTDQQAKIAAQNIIEQGETVSNTVQKLLLRGYRETEISFENNIATGYTLAECVENGCKVFDINGGGLNWIYPPEYANEGENWIYTGTVPVRYNGKNPVYDITAILPNIDEKVCQEINFKLGLAATNNEDILSSADTTIYINRLHTGSPINPTANYLDGPNIDGNPSICISIDSMTGHYTGTNQNYYVHTLYAG